MTATALLIMDVQQVLLGKVFPRRAEVTTVAEWAASLRHG